MRLGPSIGAVRLRSAHSAVNTVIPCPGQHALQSAAPLFDELAAMLSGNRRNGVATAPGAGRSRFVSEFAWRTRGAFEGVLVIGIGM